MNLDKVKKKLYLVTEHRFPFETLLQRVQLSLEAGVDMLQYRSKNADTKTLYWEARKLKELCDKYNVPLIINDRVDIALGIDAHGVHLGQDDLPIDTARSILGPEKIIGASVHNVDEAIKAVKLGANYLGVGALFYTSTKTDTKSLSIFILEDIKSNVNIPVYGIGGITPHNLTPQYIQLLDGVAVVSAILCADNPVEKVKKFEEIINFKEEY